MKQLLLLFFCTMVWTGIIAQIPEPSCDSIILRNKRVLPVRIDSITSTRAYYKKCPLSVDRSYNLPLSHIDRIVKEGQTIKNTVESKPASKSQMDKKEKEDRANLKKGENLKKGDDLKIAIEKTKPAEWTFKNTTSHKTIALAAGQSIQVNYGYENKKKKQTGHFYAINDSFLILKKQLTEITIPKKAITKITKNNALGTTGQLLGWTLAGMFFSFAAIALILSQVLSGRPSLTYPLFGIPGGCLPILILLLVIALFFIFTSNSGVIESPFSNKWIVEQKAEVHYPLPTHQSP